MLSLKRMNWTAQDIKSVLEDTLTKQGSSLSEFELSLKKDASLHKQAVDPLSFAKSLFSAMGAASVGAGALTGAGLYGAYKANQDSSDKIMKKLKEKQQYEDATRSLQAAMSNQMPV